MAFGAGIRIALRPPDKLRYFFLALFWLYGLLLGLDVIEGECWDMNPFSGGFIHYMGLIWQSLWLAAWSGLGIYLTYLKGRRRVYGVIIHGGIFVFVICCFLYEYFVPQVRTILFG